MDFYTIIAIIVTAVAGFVAYKVHYCRARDVPSSTETPLDAGRQERRGGRGTLD